MESSGNVFLVCSIARLLEGRKHVAVGANSPIPAAAALLACDLSAGETKVSLIGSRKYSHFTRLGDLFDFAAQGRLDAFFLSPGQIDGQANINLIGIGDYPRLDVRWPGSHGSPLVYMTIPNIILFREKHLKRTFVPRVDFVSAPGVSAPGIYRPGGPTALVTDLGRFSFDPVAGRFWLEELYSGHTLEEVVMNTGFTFDHATLVPIASLPDIAMIGALRERVVAQVADTYPQFAKKLYAEATAYTNRLDLQTTNIHLHK